MLVLDEKPHATRSTYLIMYGLLPEGVFPQASRQGGFAPGSRQTEPDGLGFSLSRTRAMQDDRIKRPGIPDLYQTTFLFSLKSAKSRLRKSGLCLHKTSAFGPDTENTHIMVMAHNKTHLPGPLFTLNNKTAKKRFYCERGEARTLNKWLKRPLLCH